METVTVDVVIPVYKPEDELKDLIIRLGMQKLPVRRIYLMHTRDGMDLAHREFIKGQDNIIIEEVEPESFDHGATRDAAIRMSDADYVVCMTQDAVPANSHLLSELLRAFEEKGVAAVYARQLPKKDCNIIERYIRSFNYPDTSLVKSKADLERLGIKTYFCSNVCAAYDRKKYLELGGFEADTIFNEDMLFAAKVIRNEGKVAYAAEAKVFHSHNYTNLQQFKRNFDLAVSQAQHPEIFEQVRSESEGIRMVKNTAIYLLKTRHPFMLFSLGTGSAAKYLGYLMGKHYRKLPQKIVDVCTMNPRYWRKSQKTGGKH